MGDCPTFNYGKLDLHFPYKYQIELDKTYFK